MRMVYSLSNETIGLCITHTINVNEIFTFALQVPVCFNNFIGAFYTGLIIMAKKS